MVGGCDARNDNAQKLMTNIVNTALSAKMEMGSPMICMYLLGLPDHYTSHKFCTFFWQSFIQECQKPWVCAEEGTAGACDSDLSDKAALLKHNGRVIGLSPVFDYVSHPDEINSMCLYDWVLRCEYKKKPADNWKSKHGVLINTGLTLSLSVKAMTQIMATIHSTPAKAPCSHSRLLTHLPIPMACAVVPHQRSKFPTSSVRLFHTLTRVTASTTAVQC